MSDITDHTTTGNAAKIPVAVTITDSNFFIAVFTLLLSMQYQKVRAKMHVLSVNLSAEEKRLLRQFSGTQVIEANADNTAGPTFARAKAFWPP
ncbi:MAG: hypothetical protein WCP35_16825, partial [Verrucomicrobiota bacterium]